MRWEAVVVASLIGALKQCEGFKAMGRMRSIEMRGMYRRVARDDGAPEENVQLEHDVASVAKQLRLFGKIAMPYFRSVE